MTVHNMRQEGEKNPLFVLGVGGVDLLVIFKKNIHRKLPDIIWARLRAMADARELTLVLCLLAVEPDVLLLVIVSCCHAEVTHN